LIRKNSGEDARDRDSADRHPAAIPAANQRWPSRRLAFGRAPAFARTAPKKLVMAHNVAPPESSAVAFAELAEAVNKNGSGC
jgi:hypothetical protein